MKVLVDLTYISPDSVSGVTNYAYRLLDGFCRCRYDSNVVLLVTSENAQIVAEHTGKYQQLVISLKKSKKCACINSLLNLRQLNKVIKEHGFDLFLSPYITYHGLYTTKIPSIGVFHDAQGFELMNNPLKQLVYNVFTKHVLGKQTRVVTISDFAKKDIISKVSSVRDKIVVIYNSILPKSGFSYELSITVPYILNVNTLEPYKNLITLVKAFELICDQIPHALYVKAKRLPYWDNVILPYAVSHGLEKRVVLIEKNYSEQEMAVLYKNAALFVSPSLMEGFGFTPIEAALYEVPVVCSKASALYETTRGLLNYYEPATDERALASMMLQLLQQPKDGDKIRFVAHEYMTVYSTQNQAAKFIELFETLS